MSEQMQGVLYTTGGLIVVALIGLIGSALVRRFRSRASEPEMWKRLDELSLEVYGGVNHEGITVPGLRPRVEFAERRARASASVIRDLARQWVGAPPRLNPSDIADLEEDTVPDHWKVRPTQ